MIDFDMDKDVRLSISSIRDYQTCPHYYYLKRVQKVPETKSHHADCGSLVHASFYAAYGEPQLELDTKGRMKTTWKPTGEFHPLRAAVMYQALWNRQPNDPMVHEDPSGLWADQQIVNLLSKHGLKDTDYLEAVKWTREHFPKLSPTVGIPSNFKKGQLKALKDDNPVRLKQNWGTYFYEMLYDALQEEFQWEVVAIEREIHYQLGGEDTIGYVDLVLDGPGGDIYVDLKTGYNKPSKGELFLDEQIAAYYSTNPNDFWYYHMRSGELFSVERNEAAVGLLNDVARDTARGIRMGYYPKRFTKDGCAYCSMRKACFADYKADYSADEAGFVTLD